MVILSCSEVAEIARENMQISDWVARNLIGPRRRKCPMEHQMFVNHGIEHLGLFCSTIFNPVSGPMLSSSTALEVQPPVRAYRVLLQLRAKFQKRSQPAAASRVLKT